MYYEIFEKLCRERGITPSKVSKATGISTATLTSWKQGKYTPKQDKLGKIADFFGVTVDYLMYGKMHTSDDSVQTSAVTPHYDDERTEQITRKLHDNPELAVIFNAYSDLAPEDAKLISDMIMRMSDGKRKGLQD